MAKTNHDIETGQQPFEQQHTSSIIATTRDQTTGGGVGKGGGGDPGTVGSPRTPWYRTALVVVSQIMGTGMLSLPYSAKTLGWVVTIVSVLVFAIAAMYSGWLLAEVKQSTPSSSSGGPNIRSYVDAGRELVGPEFSQFTKVSMLVNWGMLGIYFLIATADGIESISSQGFLACSINRTIVAAITLLVFAQSRDFYTISKYLSGPSAIAIITAVIVVIVVLVRQYVSSQSDDSATIPSTASFGQNTTIWPVSGTTAFDFLRSLSAIVFAYQGHSIFLELMAEMIHSEHFPKAISLAYPVMCFMYAFTIIVVYGICGSTVPGFLPDILTDGVAKTVVGVLIVIHTTVSYVTVCTPLHMWAHTLIAPQTRVHDGQSWQARGEWFLITLTYVVFGWIVTNLIPFFADVQSLIGSLFGGTIIFGWPTLYYLLQTRKQLQQQRSIAHIDSWRATLRHIGYGHALACLVFLIVLTPLFVVVGTTGAIQSLIADATAAGMPFTCD